MEEYDIVNKASTIVSFIRDLSLNQNDPLPESPIDQKYLLLKAAEAHKAATDVARYIVDNRDVVLLKRIKPFTDELFKVLPTLDRKIKEKSGYFIEIDEESYKEEIPKFPERVYFEKRNIHGGLMINALRIYSFLVYEAMTTILRCEPLLDKMANVEIKMTMGTDTVNSKSIEQEQPKKGRKRKTFRDYMIGNDNIDLKLNKLRDLISGRKGKEVALVITVAISENWIFKPTFKAVSDEFGEIGNRSGYNSYMSNRPFTDEEIEGVRAGMRL